MTDTQTDSGTLQAWHLLLQADCLRRRLAKVRTEGNIPGFGHIEAPIIEAFSIAVTVGGVEAVSARIDSIDAPSHTLILGHGAGAGMNHAHMQNICDALNSQGIAVLRFQFPYMELGKNRTDRPEVCTTVITDVVSAALARTSSPLLLGGHSFGGRMASHALAEQYLDGVRGLVLFSFPLHMPGKPAIKRAAHLPAINQPMLFLSGSRDKMAEEEQLCEALAFVNGATVHRLFTADHGFKILKRTRTDSEDVYTESARLIREWLERERL